MKTEARLKARQLRGQGLTYKEIQSSLAVSKGALSKWLRDLPFQPSAQSRVRQRIASVQNGRVNHLKKIQRVALFQQAAAREINHLSTEHLKLLGIMAYWCEGSKTQDNQVQFTNTDTALVRLIMEWFRRICCVPEKKFKVHVRCHSDTNVETAETFWSEVTGIPRVQFYRTTNKESGSKGTRIGRIPNGVVTVIVCDTELFYRIQGWISSVVVRSNGA